MKDKHLIILKIIIDRLLYFYEKYSKKDINLYAYHSLSPTNEAENVEYYIESLNWALQNRKRIKNIAIAGPYGSGKSSVIQTFQKKNINNEYHFLNISLATFKEEKKTETDEKTNDNILRLIELSILQQIFYHEEDSRIPDSRFKKIKNQKKWFLRLLTMGCIVFFLSLIKLVFPGFLSELLKLTVASKVSMYVHYISLLVTLIGFIFIINKLIRISRGFAIKKLNINNAEIEIDESVSKSILNNHIDEILYFFEVTNYNVVIIEDLDRFKQTEVFTKLREINLLINNSKQIKKDVVFVYAIRDDMLQDNDRTKFFDFMIPIIPVINSSNSNEKLLKIKEINKYKITNDLIDDISFFINDMRLLYNVMNEYYIYSKNLNNDLNQNKLLSMIVYKNIYPNDFTELSKSKGVLYETIVAKHKYIEKESEKIDAEISKVKEDIIKLEAVKIKDIKELRAIYLAKIIEKITDPSDQLFRAFCVNNRIINLGQAVEDSIFEIFLRESNSVQYYYSANHRLQSLGFEFEDVEKEVDDNFSYEEREELINEINNNQLEFLKNKIEKLEDNKKNLSKLKIKDLILKDEITISDENEMQNELINILLRNGYVDEDYLDYISIFYEGSLTKADYQFLINTKIQKNSEFDYKLYKIEKLIERLNQFEFDKEYILNNSLLDFMLEDNNQKEKRKHLFNQLKNETEVSVKFINGFIDVTANIELFIQYLCENWTNIWNFIENESDFSKEKKEKYFKLIIEYANTDNIVEIFSNFKAIISDNKNFLRIIKNTEKLKEIIELLNIKFVDIDESSPEFLLNFVVDESYYFINPKMLEFVLNHKKVFRQKEFDNQNYSAIKQSNIQNLIGYIESNINDYITAVYLKLEFNVNEPIEYIRELLNNDKILIENKERIIKRSATIIVDINEIEDSQVIDMLLNELKMIATWANVLAIYLQNENKLTDKLISFINVQDNAKYLSGKKINNENPDKETAKKFIESILLEENINNENYSYILKSIPYIYNSLGFENLSNGKVQLLIQYKKLSAINANFKMLKENFERLHILLIEKEPNKFIEDISSFELEKDDILALLKSEKLSILQKEKLIGNFDTSTFAVDLELLDQIGKLLLENHNFDTDEMIIKLVLSKSSLITLEKIDIFNKTHTLFDNIAIDEFLVSLGEPYSNIVENGKRPLIANNKTNEELVRLLTNKGYISKFEIEDKGIRISTFRNK